jgi:hypothetical protein
LPESDDTELAFFSVSDSRVDIGMGLRGSLPELKIYGNRAGLLSIANILFWFLANSYRREFLSLTSLPFVHVGASVSVSIRLTAEDALETDGLLVRADRNNQFEWAVSEEELQRIALSIHQLVSNPPHEYDRLMLAEGSVAGIEIRLTDASEWFARSDA